MFTSKITKYTITSYMDRISIKTNVSKNVKNRNAKMPIAGSDLWPDDILTKFDKRCLFWNARQLVHKKISIALAQ